MNECACFLRFGEDLLNAACDQGRRFVLGDLKSLDVEKTKPFTRKGSA